MYQTECLHGLGRAFYASAFEDKPVWTRLGRNTKALVVFDDWPEALQIAIAPVDQDKGNVSDDTLLELKRMWAPEDAWEYDPRHDQSPPHMTLLRIRVDALDERTRFHLEQGYAIRERRHDAEKRWGKELSDPF